MSWISRYLYIATKHTSFNRLRMKFTKFTRWASKLLPAAVLGAFIIGGAAMSANAGSPAFNNLRDERGNLLDYPTLQVAKNIPDAAWGTSTNASVPERVNMLVWVHQYVVGEVAHNTRAKVVLPSTAGSNHIATGSVWADNAAQISSQVAINVGQNSRVSYVAGSAKLMKNVGGQMTVVNWAPGTNGDDIVSANGVNLGDLEGCWQYAQAVFLQVDIEGGTPAINTNKKVAISGGLFTDNVEAQPGDAAEYRILFENTGNGTGHDPKIVDVLDKNHKYIANSSFARIKFENNDYDQPIPDSAIRIENQADGTQKLTYSFVDMPAQPDKGFYLHFRVRLAGQAEFPVGTTVIKNTATASFTEVSKQTNETTITVVRQEEPVVSFSLVKEVANVTIGDNTWKDELSGSAGPGDTVAFRLGMTNTGNTAAQNVTLKDILPAGMTFVEGTGRLYNKNTSSEGIAVPGNALVNNGYVFNNVQPGTANAQIFVFHAKLTDVCSGLQTLVNKGQVIWEGQVRAEDSARVIYTCNRGLIMQKDVQVPGSSEWKDNGGIVTEGVVLRYRITVTNNGNVTINNPIVRDALPSNVTYIRNSLRVDGEVMSADVQNDFFKANNTRPLTNFTPGMTKVITFEVKVNDCPDLGDTHLINTAFIKADGFAEKSDTATVTVRVNRPTLTF